MSLDSELLVDVISTDLSYLKVREGGRERRRGERGEGEREGGRIGERERERGRVWDGEGRNRKTFFVY